MFDNLSSRMEAIVKNLRGQGKLTEDNIKTTLREIRRALLEADVNFKIVKDFINNVQEKALGVEVLKSLTPGQQLIKIVHQELVNLMGSHKLELNIPTNRVNKIMIVGLQGSGKTTLCAKLANHFRKQGHKPVLVACDIYRPAAIEQLITLGKSLNIPVINNDSKNIEVIASEALSYAENNLNDLVIFDTAGRLHIDEKMMTEVKTLKDFLKADYIFFVADAMSGQDAVNVAKEFNQRLEFDGVVLTKLDGDTRGGSALSIKYTTGKPIIFCGIGEKVNDLEEFHPDRMASRILGMGDILSLIEKAEASIDQEQAIRMSQRIKKNIFTLNDFLEQLQQIKKMGPLENIFKMIPGIDSKMLQGANLTGNETKQMEAIISSMTNQERDNPSILNGSRRKRIAYGSGTSIQDVNKVLKQYEQMKNMLKQMNKGVKPSKLFSLVK